MYRRAGPSVVPGEGADLFSSLETCIDILVESDVQVLLLCDALTAPW